MSFINNLKLNKIVFILLLHFSSNIDFLNSMQSINEITNPTLDSTGRFLAAGGAYDGSITIWDIYLLSALQSV